MKKLTVRVNPEKAKNLSEVLEDHIVYETNENGIVKLVAYIPDDAVDDLLTELHKRIDLRYKKNIIEVSSPNFVISSVLSKADKNKKEEEKTPVEQLLEHANTYYHFDRDKMALIAIASIIALVGLFQNNVTIVIGAMLLAPFVGPIYAFTINTAVGKGKWAVRNLSQIGLYISISFLISMLSTLVLETRFDLLLTHEIMLRLDTNPVYILMAVMLGLAAVVSFSKGISEGLAGVAIAAAILPPAVTAGIMVAIVPHEAINAIILTFQNVIGLMAGGLIATMVLDIVPRRDRERTFARKMLARMLIALGIMIMALAVVAVFFT